MCNFSPFAIDDCPLNSHQRRTPSVMLSTHGAGDKVAHCLLFDAHTIVYPWLLRHKWHYWSWVKWSEIECERFFRCAAPSCALSKRPPETGHHASRRGPQAAGLMVRNGAAPHQIRSLHFYTAAWDNKTKHAAPRPSCRAKGSFPDFLPSAQQCLPGWHFPRTASALCEQ